MRTKVVKCVNEECENYNVEFTLPARLEVECGPCGTIISAPDPDPVEETNN